MTCRHTWAGAAWGTNLVETAGGVETHARRSEESTYFREGEVICRQAFKKKKKRKTLRLIHTIWFSERSREKGGLEDWMVSTDVMSNNWRNISVMGVYRVWNYSCCIFSEYIYLAFPASLQNTSVVTSSVRGEICVCVEWTHQIHAPQL